MAPGAQPAGGQIEEAETAQDAPESDAGIAAARSERAGREQTSEEGGSSEEEDDELEAPSIASGDESDGDEQVDISHLLRSFAWSEKAAAVTLLSLEQDF